MLNTWIGGGGGETTIIGHIHKATPAISALINGISSHAVELDDGQRFGNIHPGSPVISAVLALGESKGLMLKDFLIGVLTGYECVLRLACAIQPSHKLKGFHATGPCGTIGATMGIAAMLGFKRSQFKSAISAASTSASGILEMIEGDTQFMPYNAGKAALSGVISASMGEAGLKYPKDAMGGSRGFLSCYSSEVKSSLLLDFSQGPYFSTNYFKLYAACGHCHSGIDAALRLREKGSFMIDEIEHIVVETYSLALKGHDHNVIKGVNSAKMSIPYSVAVALIKGKAGIEEFTENAIKNPSVLDLTAKTTVQGSVELSSLAPQRRVSIVHVYTKRGVFTERVDFPKGQPENPLTTSDIENKFCSMCEYAEFPEGKAREITKMILQKDDIRVNQLMELLRGNN